VCNTTGLVYVGSTCEPNLARRLQGHKGKYKLFLDGKTSFMTSFKIFENNNYEIILIENLPCLSKDELHKRERFYIETIECVNKYIPGRKQKEYIIDNKDKIKEYKHENREIIVETQHKNYIAKKAIILGRNKQYREAHDEDIKIQKKQYYENRKETVKETGKIYRENNKEIIKERKKKYYEANKERLKEKRNQYHAERKQKKSINI
jgi:hypothetical protein